MPPPPRPAPRPQLIRLLAGILNFFLLICASVLLFLIFLAAISPPKPDIAPQQVNSYPQYIITLLLVACFGFCLFFVAFLGILSLLFFNSFMILLHVFAQVTLIGAQCVAVAFTITVRKRVHYKVEETWRATTICSEGVKCQPLERFISSERTLIALFGGFVLIQILLLALSSFLAEKRSYEERYPSLIQKAEDDDE